MIKKETRYQGKIFMEDGNWIMVDNPLQHEVLNPTYSRVVHYCPDGTGPSVWTALENLTCETCGETMPEDMQTAFALHNFDVWPNLVPRFSARYNL
jgi:hypothetical protein